MNVRTLSLLLLFIYFATEDGKEESETKDIKLSILLHR